MMGIVNRAGSRMLPAILSAVLLLVVFLNYHGGGGHTVSMMHQQLWEQQAQLEEFRIRVEAVTNETMRALAQKEELMQTVGRQAEEIRNLEAKRQLEAEILDIQCSTTREKLVLDWEKKLHAQDAALRSRDERAAELDRLLAEREVAAQQSVDGAQSAQQDRDRLLGEARGALALDARVMGWLLRAQAQALDGAWQAALAGQRQRGVVVIVVAAAAAGAGPAGGTLEQSGGGSGGGLAEAFVTLHVLRHHLNCSLPAALMYWKDAGLGGISSPALAFLQGQLPGVDLVDASKLQYPQYQRPLLAPGQDAASFRHKLKVFSIYSAPFKEVLYLDAGSLPLLDPSSLFAAEQYLRHGSLFWPDMAGRSGGAVDAQNLYSTLQLEDSPWAAEAGAATVRQAAAGPLLLDRARHWQALEWALWLNTRSEVVYRLVQGDKDTFRVAFHLAGTPASFQQVALNPAFLMVERDVKGSVQLHPSGALLLSNGSYGLEKPAPRSTHVTAASADQAAALLDPAALAVLQYVAPGACNYTLLNWPASQRSCVAGMGAISRAGLQQALLVFEIPPASHLAKAEIAAEAAYTLIRPVVAEADL